MSEHRDFFRDYQGKFAENFAKVATVLAKKTSGGMGELRPMAEEIYAGVFPFAFGAGEDITVAGVCQELVNSGVDLRQVLVKSYMLMTKDFINFLFTRSDDVIPLRDLAQLQDTHLGVVTRMFYEDRLAVDQPELDFLEVFRRQAEARNPVTLFNLYKGVPISFDANITLVGDDSVVLDVHPSQAMVLDLQRLTYLKADGFPSTVRAAVASVDVDHSLAVLRDFALVDYLVEKRRFLRVQPNGPLEVVLSDEKDRQLSGQLVDLSVGGLAIFVVRREWLEPGMHILLHMVLPVGPAGSGKGVTLHGSVVNVAGSRGPFKVGIRAHADSQGEMVINHYLTQRQTEVVRELQEYAYHLTKHAV